MSEEGTATVLVVEDQDELATAYSTVLSTEYDVRTATSGAAALEAIDEDVDVVLLDRRMPGLSGSEVLDRITERGFSVATAMLTAVEPGEDILEMPIEDYVSKPIDNEELLALAAELLERRDYDDQTRAFLALTAKKRALQRADREATDAYDAVIQQLQAHRESIDADLEGLGDELSDRAPGNLVIIDSLSDLAAAAGRDERFSWSDINYLVKGLQKASHRWGGLVLVQVNHETLSAIEHGQLVDSCSGTLQFQWETGGSTRARTLVVKNFAGVLSQIEAENIVKFETELGDAGFDISDVRKIR